MHLLASEQYIDSIMNVATIKANTSNIQYFLRRQLLLSLSRYSPEFYGTYGSLQSSRECHSTLSRSMNSQKSIVIPFLKNKFQYHLPIFTQAFWMDSFLLMPQSKICSRLLSLPCMLHSLHILPLFFDILLHDKQYKLWNYTLCILFLPFPLCLVQALFSSLCSQTEPSYK